MNETIGVKGGKQDRRRQMRIKKRRKKIQQEREALDQETLDLDNIKKSDYREYWNNWDALKMLKFMKKHLFKEIRFKDKYFKIQSRRWNIKLIKNKFPR